MAKHATDDTTETKKRGARGSASSMKVKREAVEVKIPRKRMAPRQVLTTVVVVFFAILMAASVLMPSLAQVFSSNAQRRQAEEEYAAAQAAAGSSGSAASASYDLSTVDGVIDAYSQIITSAEEKLAADPENLARILNVAQAYMNCAYNAAQLASTDEEATKVVTYFQTAEDYFDQYLAIKETDAVKVDRALCELYQGNVEEAVTELRAITAASPGYAPAWMNLGMAYEVVSMNDAAIAAYGKAQETDPTNEYGARLFATNRIQQLQSSMTSEELSYETDDTSTESNGVLDLWSDLSSGASSSSSSSQESGEADGATTGEATDEAPEQGE